MPQFWLGPLLTHCSSPQLCLGNVPPQGHKSVLLLLVLRACVPKVLGMGWHGDGIGCDRMGWDGVR